MKNSVNPSFDSYDKLSPQLESIGVWADLMVNLSDLMNLSNSNFKLLVNMEENQEEVIGMRLAFVSGDDSNPTVFEKWFELKQGISIINFESSDFRSLSGGSNLNEIRRIYFGGQAIGRFKILFWIDGKVVDGWEVIGGVQPLQTIFVCPSCGSEEGYENFIRTGLVKCKSCTSIVNLADLNAPLETQLKGQSESSADFYLVDDTLLRSIPEEVEKRTPVIDFLFERYPDVPRGLFVDFGAGYGFSGLAAQPYFERVGAIEINKETIGAVLSSFNAGQFIKVFSSLEDIESQIDVCFMWHVIEHMPDASIQLRNIYNKLSNDGCIFAQVPMYKKEHECSTHYHFLNENSVQIMCNKAGFKAVSTFVDDKNHFLTFIAIR